MSERNSLDAEKHTLSVMGRKSAKICGVREVESFDEQSVVLLTDCGELTLEGEGLHVSTLDIASGVVEVQGRVSALYYADGVPSKRGIRARFFG